MKQPLFRLLFCSFLAAAALYGQAEIVVDLKNPEFSGEVLRTEEGGVITGENLRIQARKITYTDQMVQGKRKQTVVAEEDLLLEYEGRFYVGNRLEFDLLSRQGTLLDGKTFIDIWFIGGEKIQLCDDGSFFIYGGYITTSESAIKAWEIKAGEVHLFPDGLFSARNLRINLGRLPIFWLPGFKSHLDLFRDTPLRFRLLWDKGIGPRLSARMRIFSWENFKAYARFDYRLKLGPGAALETEYETPDGRWALVTRSYGAYDKSFPDEKGKKRYRLQGLGSAMSQDGRTSFHIQWDKLSDNRMFGDFKDGDFEINTQKSTYLQLNHFAENSFASLTVRPNINFFQALNQELPYTVLGLRPLSLWKSGIIMENRVSASFFDYVYPRGVNEFLHARRSGRLETDQWLYRPFHLGPLHFTPGAGLTGIFYTQSPKHHSIGQLVYSYGAKLSTRLYRRGECSRHLIEPYLSYFGYSKPQAPVDSYFIFDIHDGYTRLDQLRFGVRNLLYLGADDPLIPRFDGDLYSYAFFGARSFSQTIPKLYATGTYNLPSSAFQALFIWNLQQNLLDSINLRFLWTVSETLALGLEWRHRSSYDWRKADHESYVLDFAREQFALLHSPLSDRRDTLLAKAHFRFSSRWNLQFEAHHGWRRQEEPNYTALKADFYTVLTSNWQMRLSYEYTPYDPYRFSYTVKLIR